MICHKCGADVADGSEFCSKCGGPLTPKAEAAAPMSGKERYQQAVGHRDKPDVAEEEVWQGTYSSKAMLGGWVGCILATIGGIVLGVMFPPAWIGVAIVVPLLWLLQTVLLLYRRMSVRYRLTTFRFFHERGLLYRLIDRVEVIDMDDIAVSQGPIERIMGTGTLTITSSDRTSPELVVPGIADVRDVAAQIDHLRRSERMRRGLSIEAI
ncbi:MAG: PH domain-containing protein [Pirellulales bacterium]